MIKNEGTTRKIEYSTHGVMHYSEESLYEIFFNKALKGMYCERTITRVLSDRLLLNALHIDDYTKIHEMFVNVDTEHEKETIVVNVGNTEWSESFVNTLMERSSGFSIAAKLPKGSSINNDIHRAFNIPDREENEEESFDWEGPMYIIASCDGYDMLENACRIFEPYSEEAPSCIYKANDKKDKFYLCVDVSNMHWGEFDAAMTGLSEMGIGVSPSDELGKAYYDEHEDIFISENAVQKKNGI